MPPLCLNANICEGQRLRVITVKRVNRCVIRYCRCPNCGNTTKHVEAIE